jgi:hypothetical protein
MKVYFVKQLRITEGDGEEQDARLVPMLTAEELVAELRAAFLCAEFGFDGDLRVRAMSRLGSTYCEPTSGVQKGAGSYRLSAWPRAARPLPNGGIRWWRLFSARYLQGYRHRGTKTSGLELNSEILVDIPVGSGGRAFDDIVVEVNFGGDMATEVVKQAAERVDARRI